MPSGILMLKIRDGNHTAHDVNECKSDQSANERTVPTIRLASSVRWTPRSHPRRGWCRVLENYQDDWSSQCDIDLWLL